MAARNCGACGKKNVAANGGLASGVRRGMHDRAPYGVLRAETVCSFTLISQGAGTIWTA